MSDRKIELKGKIHLGSIYQLIEESKKIKNETGNESKYINIPAYGHLPPYLSTSINESNSVPKFDKISYALQDSKKDLFISDLGLTQAYGIFGQPGQGKTYLLKHILRQLLTLNNKDKNKMYGGLIVDPKCDFIDFMPDAMKDAGRSLDDLIIINGPYLRNSNKSVNLLNAPLAPRDIGKLLALVSSSVVPMGGEGSYWFNNISRLLGAICDSTRILYNESPTLKNLLKIALEIDPGTNERIINKITNTIEFILKDKSKEKKGKFNNDQIESLSLNHGVFKSFLSDQKAYVLENIIRQAFGEFLFPESNIYSPAGHINETSIYEKVIEEGKIILVCPPQEEMAIRRSICTLTKCFFQQIVLSRFSLKDKGILKNNERPVFLICDEYHTVASDLSDQGIGDNYFISQSRSFGCFSLFVTQNVSQLENSQLGGNWEALFSNLQAKMFFRVGDNKTSNYASELAGKAKYTVTTRSTNKTKEGMSTGTNTNEGERSDLPPKILTSVLQQGQLVTIGSLDGGILPPEICFFHAANDK